MFEAPSSGKCCVVLQALPKLDFAKSDFGRARQQERSSMQWQPNLARLSHPERTRLSHSGCRDGSWQHPWCSCLTTLGITAHGANTSASVVSREVGFQELPKTHLMTAIRRKADIPCARESRIPLKMGGRTRSSELVETVTCRPGHVTNCVTK
jgi:hypothetical protein